MTKKIDIIHIYIYIYIYISYLYGSGSVVWTRFLNFRPRSKRTTIEIRTWEKKMVWSSGRWIGGKKEYCTWPARSKNSVWIHLSQIQVQPIRNFLETRFVNFRPRSKRTAIEIRTWERKMVWSSGRWIGAKKKYCTWPARCRFWDNSTRTGGVEGGAICDIAGADSTCSCARMT